MSFGAQGPRTRRSRSERAHSSSSTLAPEVQPAGTVSGTVVRSHGLWHEVSLSGNDAVVIATLRGQLKRRRGGTDVVAVGDRVWVALLPDNEAVIERVEPRSRTLSRLARHTKDVEQVILANPDQVMFVFAVREPEPHLRMLDRFIILAELQEIPIHIVASKVDLEDAGHARTRFRDYEGTFPVHYVSTVSGEGLEALRDALRGKISAVAGPSGVGKSSLLNALHPEDAREVGEVSGATGKGRHTTVGTRLHSLGHETFVADTPGMRALNMTAIPQDRLAWCYREFRPFLGHCYYHDCTHVHEPDCAVRQAVTLGNVPEARYEGYVALRTGGELAAESPR